MGFAKPTEQYLFSNLLIRIHVFMYLKDIIRVRNEYNKINGIKNKVYCKGHLDCEFRCPLIYMPSTALILLYYEG